MQVFLTKHALDKLDVLERHAFAVTKMMVEEAVGAPDVVDDSHAPLMIAEKMVSPTHALRVAYKVENEVKMIITLYPIRKNNERNSGN